MNEPLLHRTAAAALVEQLQINGVQHVFLRPRRELSARAGLASR